MEDIGVGGVVSLLWFKRREYTGFCSFDGMMLMVFAFFARSLDVCDQVYRDSAHAYC